MIPAGIQRSNCGKQLKRRIDSVDDIGVRALEDIENDRGVAIEPARGVIIDRAVEYISATTRNLIGEPFFQATITFSVVVGGHKLVVRGQASRRAARQ